MKALTVEVFKHSTGKWHWRFRSKNGPVIATSRDGYSRQSDARRGVIRLTTALATGEYEVKEP